MFRMWNGYHLLEHIGKSAERKRKKDDVRDRPVAFHAGT